MTTLSDQDIEDKLLAALRASPEPIRQRVAMERAGLDDKDRDLSNRASKALGRLSTKGLVKNAKPGSPLWSAVTPAPEEPQGKLPLEGKKGNLFLDDIALRLAELAPKGSFIKATGDESGYNIGLLRLFATVGEFSPIVAGIPTMTVGEEKVPYVQSGIFKGMLARRAADLIVTTMDLCRVFGVAPADLEDAIKATLYPKEAIPVEEPFIVPLPLETTFPLPPGVTAADVKETLDKNKDVLAQLS